jgi:hypothetical protein
VVLDHRQRAPARGRDRHGSELGNRRSWRSLEDLSEREQPTNFRSEVAAAAVGDQDLYVDVVALSFERGETSQ